jgi:hypothetical protein
VQHCHHGHDLHLGCRHSRHHKPERLQEGRQRRQKPLLLEGQQQCQKLLLLEGWQPDHPSLCNVELLLLLLMDATQGEYKLREMDGKMVGGHKLYAFTWRL